MKRLSLLLLFSALCLTTTTQADDKDDVTTMARGAVEKIMTLLRDKTLTDEECRTKVQSELEKVFDLGLSAKLTLGRKYWPQLTPEQQKEFQKLFMAQVLDSYFEKAKLFAETEVQYEDAVQMKTKFHVAINCLSKGEKIRINNKFYKKDGAWLAYDMEIQGISIVRSYGTQYAEILRNGSVDDLLTKMREKKPQLGSQTGN